MLSKENIIFTIVLILLIYTGWVIYDVHRNTITGLSHICVYV